MSRFQQTDLQRDISREYQTPPTPTIYDKSLNKMRWSGPTFTHKYHKCYAIKQEALKQAAQIPKGDHIRNWTLGNKQ